jgi:hypothetical protein
MLDGALLSALVQVAKGKKLLARSIDFLNPGQRYSREIHLKLEY